MMNCSNCNVSNSDSARFCSGCGADLRNQGPVVSAESEEEITRPRSGKADQGATLLDRGSDPSLGSTIAGKYRLVAKLGAGGMGTVYRAERLLIGDEVAVKILHSDQSEPRAGERFRRE